MTKEFEGRPRPRNNKVREIVGSIRAGNETTEDALKHLRMSSRGGQEAAKRALEKMSPEKRLAKEQKEKAKRLADIQLAQERIAHEAEIRRQARLESPLRAGELESLYKPEESPTYRVVDGEVLPPDAE